MGDDPLAADADAVTVAAAVAAGHVRAVEVLDAALARIAERDGPLAAFVHLDPDGARRAAADVDRQVAAGRDPGRFAGVPVGIKDLEDAAGQPTSQGSRRWQGRLAHADSLAVARLRAAGALPVGKTAAPELGMLNHTSTAAFGVTRNPWDPTRTPGGSSGGSAAAVAAGMVALATASDGGGSTRSPAAFCGLVGLKASYGRIPRLGPDVSQLAVDGALVRTVRDAARHLDVVAGPDARVRGCLPAPTVRYETAAETLPTRGLRVRWSEDQGGVAVAEDEVATVARTALERLADAAELVADAEPVSFTAVFGTYLSVGNLDPWLALEPGDWPGRADELEPFTVEALRRTEHYPLPRWVRAHRRRADLMVELAAVLSEVDVLATPTTAVPAFPADDPSLEVVAAATPYTMLANLCGVPAVSLPAGTTAAGLPVGLQLIGRPHQEEVLLRLGRVWELTSPWPRLAPASRAD